MNVVLYQELTSTEVCCYLLTLSFIIPVICDKTVNAL